MDGLGHVHGRHLLERRIQAALHAPGLTPVVAHHDVIDFRQTLAVRSGSQCGGQVLAVLVRRSSLLLVDLANARHGLQEQGVLRVGRIVQWRCLRRRVLRMQADLIVELAPGQRAGDAIGRQMMIALEGLHRASRDRPVMAVRTQAALGLAGITELAQLFLQRAYVAAMRALLQHI